MNRYNNWITVSKKYIGIYRKLQEGSLPEGQKYDGYASLFLLCACLGSRDYQSSGILAADFAGIELMMFHQLDEHQQTILKAIAIKTKGNYQILQEPKELILIAEKFAERGMDILVDTVLKEYVREFRAGEYMLDDPADHQLEKKMAMLIQQEIMRNSPL